MKITFELTAANANRLADTFIDKYGDSPTVEVQHEGFPPGYEPQEGEEPTGYTTAEPEFTKAVWTRKLIRRLLIHMVWQHELREAQNVLGRSMGPDNTLIEE